MNAEDLKYPIGKFLKPTTFTKNILNGYIEQISSFPERLRLEVDDLSEKQLNTPYRPDGWTIRQVVNHCSDSHMNGYIRLKLALTEETPIIRPYREDRWAELPDSKQHSLAPAIKILEGIHNRWATLLSSFTADQWQRKLIHPNGNREMTISELTGHYSWHGNHHLAHIKLVSHLKADGRQ